MEREEASVHSGRPRDRRPPPGGWGLDAPRIVHSIVNVQPQGQLFRLQSFADDYRRLLQEQKDTDPYDAYFADNKDLEQQIAERVDTWDETELVNDIFGDPTVLGLLQEWHEERLSSTKGPVSRGLRPTWSSVFGKVEDVSEFGDRSNLHIKGRFTPHLGRPVAMGDDNVRRLLSSKDRGRRRVPFVSGRGKIRGSIRGVRAPRISKKEAEAAGARIQDKASNSASAEGLAATTTSTAASTTGVTDINPLESPPSALAKPDIPAAELVQLENDARLIEHLAEQRAKQEIENRITKTSLEARFQRCSLMLEDSTLESLALKSQTLLPIQQRPPLNLAPPAPPRFSRPFVPIMEEELVVSVAIYSAHRPDQRMQEFVFLGSQRLSALRDAFECASDSGHREWDEFSDAFKVHNTADKKTSNSFFFIEGIFYSDSPLIRARLEKRDQLREESSRRLDELEKLRQERYQEAVRLRNTRRRLLREDMALGSVSRSSDDVSDNGDDDDMDLEFDDSDLRAQMEASTYHEQPIESIEVENQNHLEEISEDYSQIILDWVEEKPERKRQPGFGNLQKTYMHDSQIQRLSVRLNQPYLFVHQGDCEHILMFRDLRLFSQRHDDLNRLSYPLQVYKGKTTSHMCRMCKINKAFYVTVDDRLAGETPCYFCEQCYDSFHYDVDGNILYDDFRVFRSA
ncbi:small nuclear RNA activating complex, polypeptide 3 [Mortierella hygrophila]|uniref:Small nuclear RNA activating complex, polypeptide 3 n=1 Tax=Mortierella hygrophila TaxID=979708 RepID=A0A9P6FGZ4_9FUNG|nr:small nuclear RNA activating complex, polypeptide 3 [Mortierella hygrophila]